MQESERTAPVQLMFEGFEREAKACRKLPAKLRRQLDICRSSPELVAFLDIETTGLSHYYDEITVIGWSFGGCSRTIVKGQPLGQLHEDVERAKCLVTFNGIRFDTKFLIKEIPDLSLPTEHVDLMYLCRRVGLTGGQKAIEKQLNIQLRDELQNVDGAVAVMLWHQYERGDIDALKTLIRYNRSDIAAMGMIFDEAIARLELPATLFFETPSFKNWAAPRGWKTLPEIAPLPRAVAKNKYKYTELFCKGGSEIWRAVGIDLSGSAERKSGWCLLEGRSAQVCVMNTDEEIVQGTIEAKPDIVSIDSPLCLPAGRITVTDDDPGREEFGIMRECERELKRRGINVYPCLIRSMQNLTARGMRLAATLRSLGIPVIESYPGAAQDIMRIPRKGAGKNWLQLGLREFGILGDFEEASHDELDAISSALVGTFHMAGLSEALGTEKEPPLIIPSVDLTRDTIAVGLSGPISAGKTTIARELARRGFHYARFSLTLDELLVERGETLSRSNRQRLGMEIHKSGNQRWLCQRTVSKSMRSKLIVIDGLRFPDDFAYLAEQFGANFWHVFVSAEESIRRRRFEKMDNNLNFAEASDAQVEKSSESLREFAHDVFKNESSIDELSEYSENLAKRFGGE